MGILETIKLALDGIWLNKVRSMLTMLGIIIGTATIILVVAVGIGSKESVDEQYSSMSVTTIYVNPDNQSGVSSKLKYEDAAIIEENSPSVVSASVQISGKATAVYGAATEQVSVLGVEEEYQYSTDLEFTAGSFFTEESVDTKEKVVVLGYDIAETLLGGTGEEYIGQTVNLNSRKFTVVGIIERKGESVGNTSIDDGVFLPYSTAESYIVGKDAKPRIVVQAKDIDSVAPAMDEITLALRDAHNLRPTQADDFKVKDAGSKLVAAQETAKTMSILLVSIAVIVLVVGGIGIMNVMLVSVRERIKEIGTRRALGARKKDIMRQFLYEAVVLSLIGGVLGVIIGELMIPLLGYFDVATSRTVEGVILAFIFSGLVGIFFGFYPAKKAAEFNPIEALRFE